MKSFLPLQIGKKYKLVFLRFWALKLGFLGLKRYQKKCNINPPLGDTKTCQKSHFWGTFGHFKPKRSSALKMEYPKKASFFLAEISNLSCQYIRFWIGKEFRTSKFKLDELFQFFQKISNFGVFKEKCVYTIQKIGKKVISHQKHKVSI